MTKLPELSSAARDVFFQMRKGAVWDGDLASKSGRMELIKLGLAKRGKKDGQDGMNWLSDAGKQLAIKTPHGLFPRRDLRH